MYMRSFIYIYLSMRFKLHQTPNQLRGPFFLNHIGIVEERIFEPNSAEFNQKRNNVVTLFMLYNGG